MKKQKSPKNHCMEILKTHICYRLLQTITIRFEFLITSSPVQLVIYVTKLLLLRPHWMRAD